MLCGENQSYTVVVEWQQIVLAATDGVGHRELWFFSSRSLLCLHRTKHGTHRLPLTPYRLLQLLLLKIEFPFSFSYLPQANLTHYSIVE